jgi:hypothetical protein
MHLHLLWPVSVSSFIFKLSTTSGISLYYVHASILVLILHENEIYPFCKTIKTAKVQNRKLFLSFICNSSFSYSSLWDMIQNCFVRVIKKIKANSVTPIISRHHYLCTMKLSQCLTPIKAIKIQLEIFCNTLLSLYSIAHDKIQMQL